MSSTARARGGRPSQSVASGISGNILEIAARLFASQGYAATSMEQIASACGSGKDTIYRRFASKADLYSSVLELKRRQCFEMLDRFIPTGGDSMTTLKATCRWMLTTVLSPEIVAFNRIALSEALPFPKAEQSNCGRDQSTTTRLISLVAAAQTDGLLIDGDPAFIVTQLTQAITGAPLNDAMLGGKNYATVEEQDAYFEKAWRLFLSGATPNPRA
jgi:TetR/AcrR family transcriptional regulator of autoinduction and epiphytic fitness